MNNDFPFRLKMLMDQLRISNAQLARGVNVDPSLISRWLRTGCGARKAADHASAIGQYVAKRRLSPENRAWLNATVGAPATAATSRSTRPPPRPASPTPPPARPPPPSDPRTRPSYV